MEKISNPVATEHRMSANAHGGGRLKYVDIMRGITMILVVYGHMAGEKAVTPLSGITLALRMPLFFFISGFIAYKDAVFWNKQNYCNRLLNKSRVQLIPTFVFWGIYSIFIQVIVFPAGYWFTLTLFVIFAIYFTTSFFLHKKGDKPILITMAMLAGLLVVFRSQILAFLPNSKYYCINEVATYLGFFVFGLCFRKYQVKCHKVLAQHGIIAGLFIAFTALYYVSYYYDGISFSATAQRYLLGLPAIFIFYNYFYIHREYWALDGWISRKLQFIGRRTLDIYMLHYFFIQPSIPWGQRLFTEYNNDAFVIIMYGSLTCVVILLCLFISSLLRSSSFLAYWLFGLKKTT